MAITLLDGSNATIDIQFGSVSYKCVASSWTGTFNVQFTEAVTFCSGGWQARTPGLKQLIIRMTGFMSTGFSGSDPLELFTHQDGVSFVLQATSGCTISGTCHAASYASTVVAAAQTGVDISAESTGPVTTVWITA